MLLNDCSTGIGHVRRHTLVAETGKCVCIDCVLSLHYLSLVGKPPGSRVLSLGRGCSVSPATAHNRAARAAGSTVELVLNSAKGLEFHPWKNVLIQRLDEVTVRIHIS